MRELHTYMSQRRGTEEQFQHTLPSPWCPYMTNDCWEGHSSARRKVSSLDFWQQQLGLLVLLSVSVCEWGCKCVCVSEWLGCEWGWVCECKCVCAPCLSLLSGLWVHLSLRDPSSVHQYKLTQLITIKGGDNVCPRLWSSSGRGPVSRVQCPGPNVELSAVVKLATEVYMTILKLF